MSRLLVDRDSKTQTEIAELEATGAIIWRRRELENYLLDESVLRSLVAEYAREGDDQQHIVGELIAVRDAPTSGASDDDVKARKKNVFDGAKRLLPSLSQAGSNWSAFAEEHLALLVAKDSEFVLQLAKEMKLGTED